MTIYLEPNEEITSVVDHLIQSDTDEVIFVIPIGAQILQSLINLKILKREADNLKKKVIVVTQDQHGQNLARRAGLETYSSKDKIDHFLNNLTLALPVISFDAGVQLEKGDESDILFVKNQPLDKLLSKKIEGSHQDRSGQTIRVVDIIKPDPSPFYFPSDQKRFFKEREEPVIKEKLYRHDYFSGTNILSWFNLRRVIILLAGLFLVVGFFVGWSVLPRAEITLYPKTEIFPSEIIVQTDKNISQINFSLNKIPAQLIKLEKNENREFLSSGERQVNERARGIITIYNEYSSNSQALVESTRFISKEGKLFRLTKTIMVPGAKVEEGKIVSSSIDAEVVADEPGDVYNIIGSNYFTIPGFQGTPKYTAFYGRSSVAMSGGLVGKVKIISQDDFDNAKKTLIKDLKEMVYRQIKEEIPTDFKLLDGAINEKLMPIFTSPEVGAQATKFTLNTKIVLEGLIFNEKDLKELIKKNIEFQLSDRKKIIDRSLIIDYKKVSVDFKSGMINLDIHSEVRARGVIDMAKIKEQVRGKDETKIKEVFSSLGDIESIKINFWPLWVKKIPKNVDKIKILIGVD